MKYSKSKKMQMIYSDFKAEVYQRDIVFAQETGVLMKADS